MSNLLNVHYIVSNFYTEFSINKNKIHYNRGIYFAKYYGGLGLGYVLGLAPSMLGEGEKCDQHGK